MGLHRLLEAMSWFLPDEPPSFSASQLWRVNQFPPQGQQGTSSLRAAAQGTWSDGVPKPTERDSRLRGNGGP